MGVPIRVLPLQDVDDVVQDLRVVGVQGRGPGQHHTPGVKLHGQWLPWSAGNVWTLFELEIFFLGRKYEKIHHLLANSMKNILMIFLSQVLWHSES